MKDFDPANNLERCAAYLSDTLRAPVQCVRAARLPSSSREAPWRLDVELDGVPRSFVLRLNPAHGEFEYKVLSVMDGLALPTPRVYGWDPAGSALGAPCFFEDFITGDSLLPFMLAGERWAEELYVDTVCQLQEIDAIRLKPVLGHLTNIKTANSILADSREFFRRQSHGLATAVLEKLTETPPPPLPPRFSNGDLYPANFIVHEKVLAGVIDWEKAGFTDPIYEFWIVFSAHPQLRGRGLEERYFNRMGFDVERLHWYRGLEGLASWVWVERAGQSFHDQTTDNLQRGLQQWLAKC